MKVLIRFSPLTHRAENHSCKSGDAFKSHSTKSQTVVGLCGKGPNKELFVDLTEALLPPSTPRRPEWETI